MAGQFALQTPISSQLGYIHKYIYIYIICTTFMYNIYIYCFDVAKKGASQWMSEKNTRWFYGCVTFVKGVELESLFTLGKCTGTWASLVGLPLWV